MKLTVITVCYNAEKTITRTFESVLNQNFIDFEYWVIDGKSVDNTVDIIKKYKKKFQKKGIGFNWISELDKGLYDAMNKGALCASGEWLIYMNADDEFSNNDVVTNVFLYDEKKIDIIYGDSIIVSKEKESIKYCLDIDSIVKHLPFIPQSAFVRSEIQRQFSFDIRFQISADFDSFLRMYLTGCEFMKVNDVFSKFYVGGVSNRNIWETYKEDIEVKVKNGIIKKRSIKQLIFGVRRWILIKLFIGKEQ